METSKAPLPLSVEAAELEEIESSDTGIALLDSKDKIEDLFYIAANIEKVVEAQNKIRGVILKLAQAGDWFLFKSENDAAGKAEIGFAGAERISTTLGVNFENWSREKITGTDEYGDWYRWEFECDAVYGKRRVRVYGRCGTRTKFFGRAHGAHKPLRDCDEGDIKISAWRGAMKEGVKTIFGLHHMNPSFITAAGISLVEAKGFDFKGKESEIKEGEAATVTLLEVREKKTEKWTKYFLHDNEGVIYSSFDEKYKKMALEHIAAKKQSSIWFKKTKWGLEITGMEVYAPKEAAKAAAPAEEEGQD